MDTRLEQDILLHKQCIAESCVETTSLSLNKGWNIVNSYSRAIGKLVIKISGFKLVGSSPS